MKFYYLIFTQKPKYQNGSSNRTQIEFNHFCVIGIRAPAVFLSIDNFSNLVQYIHISIEKFDVQESVQKYPIGSEC